MTQKNVILTILAVILVGVLYGPSPSLAAGDAPKPAHQHWHFSGMKGQFDKAAMQRGLKVYREVCAACHSLDLVAYRSLTDLGYTEAQIKNIAAEYTVMDGPNDDGDMFERPARPSDQFVSPYENAKQAVAANGAMPPDLSLITKARHHGPDYLFGLLTGYEDSADHHDVPEGKYWNKYFPGHVISMAPPLMDGQVAYEDGSPETVEQYSHDIVNFLVWAADPYLETRKRAGVSVLIFLIVFAGVMYGVKKRVWKDVH